MSDDRIKPSAIGLLGQLKDSDKVRETLKKHHPDLLTKIDEWWQEQLR